jgi:predicted methyltransferase
LNAHQRAGIKSARGGDAMVRRFAAAVAVAVAVAMGLSLGCSAAPATAELSGDDLAKLDAALADPRRDQDRGRDAFRHPRETLEFFGVTPDMLVVEAIPGDGWYARILLPYLAPEGGYAAVGYSVQMTERLASGPLTPRREAVVTGWPARYLVEAAGYGPSNASIEAVFLYGSIPETVRGEVDAVLYIRALHHLARSGELQNALLDTFDMLKPGGVVGVVQHATQATTPADYDVSGALGYMRAEDVIKAFEGIGFVYEGASDVNANPRDTADHAGGSWTMAPTGHSAAVEGLGETNRMTLRFRKPAE